jgi:hypothetical protein
MMHGQPNIKTWNGSDLLKNKTKMPRNQFVRCFAVLIVLAKCIIVYKTAHMQEHFRECANANVKLHGFWHVSIYILTHFILLQSNDETLHKRAKVNISIHILGSVFSTLFPTLAVLSEISEGTIYLNGSKYN